MGRGTGQTACSQATKISESCYAKISESGYAQISESCYAEISESCYAKISESCYAKISESCYAYFQFTSSEIYEGWIVFICLFVFIIRHTYTPH